MKLTMILWYTKSGSAK